MKTKPILIAAFIALIASTVFFARCKNSNKAEASEITEFLNKFNNSIKEGNTDTLMACFQVDRSVKSLPRLISILTNKNEKNGSKPIAQITLDIDNIEIKTAENGIAITTIPVTFAHEALANKPSILRLKIIKVSTGQLKIIQADTRQLFTDYITYENYIRSKTIPDKDIYSEITLKAFKNAEKLKAKYDSVVWFEHINNKTFFTVIKGKLNTGFFWGGEKNNNEAPTYKMGLVNPEFKEIIPAKYDLIHNIGGTVDGLIEVEKDHKKGLYNLAGNIILPVEYDQVFPLNNEENLALLRKNDDYFYLKKDFIITDKIADFKIADELPKIKFLNSSSKLSDKSSKNVMEFNSRDDYTSLIISPSYLVEMNILPKFLNFQDPLRSDREEGEGEGSQSLDIKFNGVSKDEKSWFENAFYSVVDDYLGSRAGLYETKKVIVIDKKQNRISGFSAQSYFGGAEGGGYLSGLCNENTFRAVNDTLFEFKTTSMLDQSYANLSEGPYYHYLHIKNGKLVALPCERLFACTKYVKMDESYLNSCYVMDKKAINHVTMILLSYMKNEIYASYGYQFKSSTWTQAFDNRFDRFNMVGHASVDDSLTVIDKYNIEWINKKLNAGKPQPKVLAAK